MKIRRAPVECLLSCGFTLKRLIPEGKEAHSVCITSERSAEEQAGATQLENHPESLTGGLSRRSERAVVGAAALSNTYAACTRLLWGACQRVPVFTSTADESSVGSINGAKMELSLLFQGSTDDPRHRHAAPLLHIKEGT